MVYNPEEAFAPHYTLTGQASYRVPIDDHRNVTFTADMSARTKRYTDNFANPGAALPGFVKGDLDVTLDLTRQLQLEAYVHNVGNKLNAVYSSNSFGSVGIIQFRYAEPRTYGASLSFKW